VIILFIPFRIPLVPRRPKSGDVASTKEKKDKRSSKEKRDKSDNQSETPVLPSDPDERVCLNFLVKIQA
jgi:hypothetical protein